MRVSRCGCLGKGKGMGAGGGVLSVGCACEVCV